MHLVAAAIGTVVFVALLYPIPYALIRLADKTLFREL